MAGEMTAASAGKPGEGPAAWAAGTARAAPPGASGTARLWGPARRRRCLEGMAMVRSHLGEGYSCDEEMKQAFYGFNLGKVQDSPKTVSCFRYVHE